MSAPELFQQINTLGIIPVIAIENPDTALPLADAFLANGLPIIEITFRTAAAAQVIQLLARERPSLLVGAGTILTSDNLLAAQTAGARFGVAPGLNPNIVRQAAQLNLPFVPGVATPSEIEQALALDCRVLKFFPAEQLGGLAMINALAAPYGHTGVKFVPTGGVNPANLASYLTSPAVAAVGGTWLAKKEDLAAARWEDIGQRCRATVEIVRRARGAPR